MTCQLKPFQIPLVTGILNLSDSISKAARKQIRILTRAQFERTNVITFKEANSILKHEQT
jgi:hypothetical protein